MQNFAKFSCLNPFFQLPDHGISTVIVGNYDKTVIIQKVFQTFRHIHKWFFTYYGYIVAQCRFDIFSVPGRGCKDGHRIRTGFFYHFIDISKSFGSPLFRRFHAVLKVGTEHAAYHFESPVHPRGGKMWHTRDRIQRTAYKTQFPSSIHFDFFPE
jgi:hypothetical protein